MFLTYSFKNVNIFRLRYCSLKSRFFAQMVFLVVKFMYVDLNEVVPDWWTTKDNYCYWPPKDHQEKVLKGELLRTSWAKYAIKKIPRIVSIFR